MEGHNPRPQPGYGGVHQTPSGNLMVGPARTRSRFIWTRQLHNQFTAVVAQLGLRNAKPKNILRLMNVNGLTRRIVASHLQKYRIYLRRCLDGNGVVNEFPRQSNFPSYTNSCPCCCRPFGSVGVAMQQHSQETHIPRAPNPWNTGQYGLLSSNSSFIYGTGNSNLRMGIPVHTPVGQPYVQDVEPSANGNGRELKLLDLFPIRDV